MSSVDLPDRASLKELLKEAATEVLQERRDLLEHAVLEAIEDMGMLKALQEADLTDNIGTDAFLAEFDQGIESTIPMIRK